MQVFSIKKLEKRKTLGVITSDCIKQGWGEGGMGRHVVLDAIAIRPAIRSM